MSKLSDFRHELHALLAKYDAVLSFEVGEGSDTHGLYDERFTVSFFNQPEGNHFKTTGKEHTIAPGWSIDQSDLT